MSSPGSVNITGEFYERPYNAAAEGSLPPDWFQHVTAVTAPTYPTFPGTLTMQAQIEVGTWLSAGFNARAAILARCSEREAVSKIAEYTTFLTSSTYVEWSSADKASRVAQWKLFCADALVANKLSVPVAVSAPSGSGAPTAPFTQATNLAD